MAERKRILYLIDGLGRGGAERLLFVYLEHLDRERFEPRVCALQTRDGNPIGEQIRALGIPVDSVPVPYLRDISALPRLWAYMRRHRIDLVHTQLEFANTFGNIAAGLNRLPSVCTLHSVTEPARGSKARRRVQVMWWSLRRFCNRAIAVSEETRQYHLRVSRNAPEKVITLYNGINIEAFDANDVLNAGDQQRIRDELALPSNAKVLITVAVLRQPKGIQFLIEALPMILAEQPDTYYVIVGDGEYREALEACAQTHGVKDRVVFAGFRQDIPQLMAISDIFVLPTLGDALPTVVAEAMAARKPVIASAIGGVPEMVDDQHSGLLVPPGDVPALAKACVSLLKSADQRQAMGLRGREIAEERFNIPQQARRLEAIYEELLTRDDK